MPRSTLRRLVIALYLLATAGFAFVVVDRWWPCAIEGIESPACFARYDDVFEQGMTLGGPHAVHLVVITAAYVALGIAIGLAGHVASTPRQRIFGWLAAIPALFVAVSYLGGIPQESGWWGWVMVIAPIASPIFAALSVTHLSAGPWAGIYGITVACTTMLFDLYLTLILSPLLTPGWFSHDTQPGMWLPTTLACLLSALAFARVTGRLAGPGASDDRMGAWTSSSGR